MDNLSQKLNTKEKKNQTIGYNEKCLEAASEGIVLLENDGTLPIKNEKISVFGRCQYDYFYIGYGSGGDVNAPYKINLIDGLNECKNLDYNHELALKYQLWCNKHPNIINIWGMWPRYFEEMPISKEDILQAKSASDVAIIVIGRSAGEDRESLLEEGSYYLTKKERDILKNVTSIFSKTVVIVNTGNLIDFSWIKEYSINSVILAWQGGMESGRALAKILSGEITPSGHLPDTIAASYDDYPSSKDFGNRDFNNYTEDIYVGYRYFETFKKEKVLYPFGYGLSYTKFEINNILCEKDKDEIKINFNVKNIGNYLGKEVIQIYVEKPNGVLNNPARELVAFYKTNNLKSNETQNIEITLNINDFSSFDDSGKTNFKDAFVLLKGVYNLYLGENVRDAKLIFSFEEVQDYLIYQCQDVLGPKKETFKRLVGDNQYEATPMTIDHRKEYILSSFPIEIKKNHDNILFDDVISGKKTIDEFIGSLNVKDLESLTRGYGIMNSKLGVRGNAGVLGGYNKSLREKHVPIIVTTDGPAGVRIKETSVLLPCGTCIASTWNKDLIYEIGKLIGAELNKHHSDVILAPGMNIHRNPLCGRNFEYYSEDPLLTGKCASSFVKGVESIGLSACPKHFACNNQEVNRNYNDSRVSKRALREIYLKGFEIVVKEAHPNCIMTSYNKINGVWSHYNYELVNIILKEEWSFKGLVMTDWWMRNDTDPDFNDQNNAYRVRGGIDVLMPGGALWGVKKGDNSLIDSYKKKIINLSEIQKAAKNTLNLCLLKAKH